ncbi:hypothetical protein PAAG_06242 [Paracoccidioides lutzii Pb01]|uniref:Gag1-like clamp domain-containing protein n=1 Tax=Paracoccidioides lutzii (strain ATCC MYA-826 / Pb01) TaxID=502779 RepID=C1H5P7_PARBA|nr:hypothetical protein PAAG_06242 [Paracoccidioides lutzii Pb01]EEH35195.1 hypothetical protein PAAG_06242 [Paracoccidioides lutzii Pb01]
MDLTQPEEPASPTHPTSVFASLHRKPRQAPNRASDLNDSRETAVKSAKRYLLERIRDDWTYEHQSDTPSSPASLHIHTEEQSSQVSPATRVTTASKELQADAREVREWREREQDSSCSEAGVGVALGAGQRGDLPSTFTTSDPYRFESPDAVELSMLERKRKRRRVVEEEMAWNEGLRIWMERRNAWTGARMPSTTPKGGNESVMGNAESSGASIAHEESDDAEMVSPAFTGDGKTSSSANSLQTPDASRPSSERPTSRGEPLGAAIEEASSLITSNDNASKLHLDSEEPLVPIVEPLLPLTNPIRASIKPSIYPSIYSKVVIQSLTPAIPINLSDVIKALVQGWKADGEWPPKPTTTHDVPVVKKRSAKNAPAEGAGISRRLSGSSVTGAMKKVLGLSGIHPARRFHIRGGSQGGSGAGEPPASGVAFGAVTEARQLPQDK